MNPSFNNSVSIKNKRASYDYFFLLEFTAGIQLVGSEVKQIRKGKVSLVDSYCLFDKGELFVKGMNITASEEAFTHEPLRTRKLLLNKIELNKIQKELLTGITIIVKRIFTNERGLIKIDIAVAQGKKNYDKRASIKEKDIKRELTYNESI